MHQCYENAALNTETPNYYSNLFSVGIADLLLSKPQWAHPTSTSDLSLCILAVDHSLLPEWASRSMWWRVLALGSDLHLKFGSALTLALWSGPMCKTRMFRRASLGDCTDQFFAKHFSPTTLCLFSCQSPCLEPFVPLIASKNYSFFQGHHPIKMLLPLVDTAPHRAWQPWALYGPSQCQPSQKAFHVPLLWLLSLFPYSPHWAFLLILLVTCLGASLWHLAQDLQHRNPIRPLSLEGDTNATGSFIGNWLKSWQRAIDSISWLPFIKIF